MPKPPPNLTIVVIPSAYPVIKGMVAEHEGLCPTAGVISMVELLAGSYIEILRGMPPNPTLSNHALRMTTVGMDTGNQVLIQPLGPGGPEQRYQRGRWERVWRLETSQTSNQGKHNTSRRLVRFNFIAISNLLRADTFKLTLR